MPSVPIDSLIAQGQQQLEIARQVTESAPIVGGLFLLAGIIIGWLLGWLFLGAGPYETRIIQSTARQNYSSGYRRGFIDGNKAQHDGFTSTRRSETVSQRRTTAGDLRQQIEESPQYIKYCVWCGKRFRTIFNWFMTCSTACSRKRWETIHKCMDSSPLEIQIEMGWPFE